MDSFVEQIVNGVVERLALKLQVIDKVPEVKHNIGNIHQASKLTGWSVTTLYIKHHKKQIPESVCFRKGGRLFWDLDQLMDWIKQGNERKV